MNDTTAPKRDVNVDGKELKTRVIKINNKEVEVIKLEQIAEVKQGLATGQLLRDFTSTEPEWLQNTEWMFVLSGDC